MILVKRKNKAKPKKKKQNHWWHSGDSRQCLQGWGVWDRWGWPTMGRGWRAEPEGTWVPTEWNRIAEALKHVFGVRRWMRKRGSRFENVDEGLWAQGPVGFSSRSQPCWWWELRTVVRRWRAQRSMRTLDMGWCLQINRQAPKRFCKCDLSSTFHC